MNNLYENDDYVVIHEYGWGGDCEWEYYISGYECDEQFTYAVLDKHEKEPENDGGYMHIGHLCEKHIHEVWMLLTNTHMWSH